MPVRINKFPHDKERRELSCYIPRILKKGMPLFCHVPVLHFFYSFFSFLRDSDVRIRSGHISLELVWEVRLTSCLHLNSRGERPPTPFIPSRRRRRRTFFFHFFPETSRCLTQGGGDRREWIETNASPRWTKRKRPCRLY